MCAAGEQYGVRQSAPGFQPPRGASSGASLSGLVAETLKGEFFSRSNAEGSARVAPKNFFWVGGGWRLRRRARAPVGPCRPGCWASCTLPEYQQAGAIVNRCGLASLSQDQKLYIASRLKRGGAYSVVIALWRFFAWAPGCWACGCCGLPGWLPPGLLLW